MPTAALIGPLSVRRDADAGWTDGWMASWWDGQGCFKDAFICAEDVLIFYSADLAASRN